MKGQKTKYAGENFVKDKKTTYVKRRHKFFFAIGRPFAHMIAWKYHFKTKVQKLKKGEQYFIISNHQGLFDPVFVALTFKAPVYFVASDTMFSTKWYSRLLIYAFAPIKKRKSVLDVNCVRTIKNIVREGGNVALFPEANRCWCDFQFNIDRSICKMVRMLKLPIILYNFNGCYGTNPRWSDVVRKGESSGAPKKVLSWEEICAMDDDTLYNEIVSNLKVIDSDSGKLYKSKKRAEDLERMLFVCPKCGAFSTLHSHGTTIKCSNCNLEVEYGEDLRPHSADSSIKFEKMVDWYKFQLESVKNFHATPNQSIFVDQNIELWDKSTVNHVLMHKGEISLDDTNLKFGDISFPLDSFTSATALGGRKLIINIEDKSYIVIGGAKFNPLKYLLFFNILCKQIAEKGGDEFYGLSINDANC